MLMPESAVKRWFLGTVLFLMFPMEIIYATVAKPQTVHWIIIFNCLMYVAVIAFVTLVPGFARKKLMRVMTIFAMVALVLLAFASPFYAWLKYIFPVVWLLVLALSLLRHRASAS